MSSYLAFSILAVSLTVAPVLEVGISDLVEFVSEITVLEASEEGLAVSGIAVVSVVTLVASLLIMLVPVGASVVVAVGFSSSVLVSTVATTFSIAGATTSVLAFVSDAFTSSANAGRATREKAASAVTQESATRCFLYTCHG